MCTRLKVAAMYITPGMVIQYRTLSAIKTGRFGIITTHGLTPNARSENLMTVWKHLIHNRAIIEVDGFKEGGIGFGKTDKPTKIACLFDAHGSLVVLTTDAIPEVAKVHHRMPAIIEDEQAWLVNARLKFADSDIQQKMI